MTTTLHTLPPYIVGEEIRLYNRCCIAGSKEYLADRSVDLLIADPSFAIDEQRLAPFYTKYPDRVIPGSLSIR